MNAVEMLIEDHRKVDQLFQEFQQGGDDAEKQQLGEEICTELFVHSKLEEEIFYPAFRSEADAQGKELIAEAYAEHAEVDQLVEQLRGMSANDGQYTTLMQELIQNVQHHVQEEETELLPQAREMLGTKLDQLGQEMMQRKQQLMATAQAMR